MIRKFSMVAALVIGLGVSFNVSGEPGHSGIVHLVDYHTMDIPITPFSNMASGYQATNPGFRAILKSETGEFVAGGPLTMDAVIKGYSDDASKGSPYGKLVMRMDMTETYPGLTTGALSGKFRGTLSICMADDPEGRIANTRCRNLRGNIHPERPFQWINKKVEFVVENGNVRITRYYGRTGDGGTPQQLSLVAYHAAYGFAAPGKAFKDYQSPLVLDLDPRGKASARLDLVNVWDEQHPVRFDLTGVGQKVRTGWIGSQSGLLFWDRGTGCVENGTQLFGESFESKNGESTYHNGFEALRAKVSSTNRTKITDRVEVEKFPELKIWRNTALDGICKKSEVVAASDVVKTILLSYRSHNKVSLNEDNEVRLTGHFIGKDGKRHRIGDVWFKQRRNDLAKKQ